MYRLYEEAATGPLGTFTRRLHIASVARKVRLMDVAKAIGVNPKAISDWNHGKRGPCLANAIAVAKVLNVSLDWLAGLSDDGGPEIEPYAIDIREVKRNA